TVRTIARAEGLGGTRLVELPPPNIAVKSTEEVHAAAIDLLDGVIKALTTPVIVAPVRTPMSAPQPAPVVKSPREIVFKGSLNEVNEYFIKNVWCDGLPIVPPTLDLVDEMLSYTDRSPDEVIGILKPKHLSATVWTVAVNGVMAGCRPEYMPVMLAII